MSSTETTKTAFKFDFEFQKDFFGGVSMFLIYNIELQLHVLSSFMILCHKYAYYHRITTLREESIFSSRFWKIVFVQSQVDTLCTIILQSSDPKLFMIYSLLLLTIVVFSGIHMKRSAVMSWEICWTG
jgi:hypothetical protein